MRKARVMDAVDVDLATSSLRSWPLALPTRAWAKVQCGSKLPAKMISLDGSYARNV